MRLGELAITIVTLGAIASTFFLYQNHAALYVQSPEASASQEVSKNAPVAIEGADGVATVIASEHITPDEEAQTPTTSTPTSTSSERSITIEAVPLSDSDEQLLKKKIHTLTNLSRTQNNLAPFTLDERLSELGADRSIDMIEHDYFSHTSSDGCDLSCRFENAQYRTQTWGENLATTNSYHHYTLDELASQFVNQWLKSSRHRDNILSDKFTHHGIGIAVKDDRIIVTVIFARP